MRLFINRNAHTAAATAKGTKNSPARDSANPTAGDHVMGGMISAPPPPMPPAAFSPSAPTLLSFR